MTKLRARADCAPSCWPAAPTFLTRHRRWWHAPSFPRPSISDLPNCCVDCGPQPSGRARASDGGVHPPTRPSACRGPAFVTAVAVTATPHNPSSPRRCQVLPTCYRAGSSAPRRRCGLGCIVCIVRWGNRLREVRAAKCWRGTQTGSVGL